MGGDLSGYIVLEGLEIIGYSGIHPCVSAKVVFFFCHSQSAFLPLFYELMNNAGSTHVATPDHVAIMAAFISAKYFSKLNLWEKNTQGTAAPPGTLFKLSWLHSSKIADFIFSHVVL